MDISKGLRPLAISGTRTIEPGRAFIKLPAAKRIGAPETGAEISWFVELTAAGACDTLVSAADDEEQATAFVVLFVCIVEAAGVATTADGIEADASLNSCPGTTVNNKTSLP